MQKYKLTKAIRFKASATNAPLLEQKAKTIEKESKADLSALSAEERLQIDAENKSELATLIEKGYHLINNFENLIFEEREIEKTGEIEKWLRATIFVHFRWLRQYTRFEWYEEKEQQARRLEVRKERISREKQHTQPNPEGHTLDPNLRPVNTDEKKLPLYKAFYLKNQFLAFCQEWRCTLDALDKAIKQPLENRARRADIAFQLNQFAKRSVLLFLKDFLNDANDKESERAFNALRKAFDEFEQILIVAQTKHLPAQRKGVQLARATFNFHTLDRKGNQYKAELKTIEQERDAAYSPTNQTLLPTLTANAVASFQKAISRTREEIGKATQKIEEAKIDGRKEKAEKLTINKRKLVAKLPDLEDKLKTLQANGFEGLNVSQLYDIIKTYKAQEKSAFMEALAATIPLEYTELKERFSLFVTSATTETKWNKDTKEKEYLNFSDKENFDNLQRITRQAEAESKSYNGKIQDGVEKDIEAMKNQKKLIKKLRQQRSAFFQSEVFKTYNNLCEVYQEIAKKRGEYKGRIKGAERAHFDAERLQYWAMLAATKNEKGKNSYQLVLIPKDKAEEAYNRVEAIKESGYLDYHAENMLYYFESFSFRSLRKLTFTGEQRLKPELLTEMWDDLARQYPNAKRNDFGEHSLVHKVWKEEQKKVGKDQYKTVKVEHIDQKQTDANRIAFYKAVLSTEYLGKQLKFADKIDGIDATKCETFEQFEVKLERSCYQQNWLLASDILKTLKVDYNAQIVDLSSLDLRRSEKDNFKTHTQIWDKFWSLKNEADGFDLRLNPEIAIFWREANGDRVKKYGKDSDLYDEKKHNRYLHSQYTVAFTVSENALSPQLNYAFARFDKQKEALEKFNETVNTELRKGLKPESTKKLASFGIDTGEAELATLGLTDDGKPSAVEILQLRKDKLGFKKQGFFKDGKARPKPYYAVDNMSYFLNEKLYNQTFRDDEFQATKEELFERLEIPTIDLTCAKVICGEIVLNGDIKTRQKLNFLNAKRKIWEELKMNPASEDVKFDKEAGKIFVPERREDKVKEGKTTLAVYHNSPEINSVKSFQWVEEELRKYIAQVKSNTAEVLENINDYRKVCAANMVGVIAKLASKFPLVIAIENLHAGSIEKHRLNYEGMMDRPLEHALYRRFQVEGYTPPLSNLVALRTAIENPKAVSEALQRVKEKFSETQKTVKATKIKLDKEKDGNKKKKVQADYDKLTALEIELEIEKKLLEEQEAKQSQYGFMRFINESSTSKICPSCRKNAYNSKFVDFYLPDKKAEIFHCRHRDCGWHNKTNNKGLNLHSNDAVAAYNIAMRGRIFKQDK